MEFQRISPSGPNFLGEKKNITYTIFWNYYSNCFNLIVYMNGKVHEFRYRSWRELKKNIPKPHNLNKFDSEVETFVADIVSRRI